MFSRGPKAHNGEDSADGRSVQFTSHCQYKIGGKQSIDSHVEHSAGTAFISQIICSADSIGFDNSSVRFPDTSAPHRNPKYNHSAKQYGQHDSKDLIVSRGPNEPGFYLHSKGF